MNPKKHAATEEISSGGRVVFQDSFSSGIITVDDNVNANDHTWGEQALMMPDQSTVTIVQDPAGSGQLVARFLVPDDGQSFRAELGRNQFNWGRYRYTVSHYVPSDWPAFDGTILTQWHGYTINCKNLNPPIALAISGDTPEWQLHMYRMKPMSHPTADPVMFLEQHVLDVPMVYDQWNDWVFDITWSRKLPDGTLVPGLVVLTHNGRVVARVEGENNFHQDWPPYFHTGIYRPQWREASHPPVVGKPVVVYQRDVVVTEISGEPVVS